MTLPGHLTPSAVTEYIISVLRGSADSPYVGEPVSQLSHSLQVAHLASTASSPPADDETIIGGLLHDIGQFAPEADINAALSRTEHIRDIESTALGPSVGRYSHDRLGAQFLAALGFPAKTCTLVGEHVNAKRYLCGVDESYHDLLSEASKESLKAQGGAMGESERREYDRTFGDEWVRDICRMRRWDDEGKIVGGVEGDLDGYRIRMERVLATF